MRSIRIPADKTISIAELDEDVVLILAAGVALTLPRPSGDRRLYVRAEGAGASVICPAGIDTGSGSTSTAAIGLATGEVVHLVAYYDAAAGTHSAWLALGAVAGQLASKGYHAPVRLMSAGALAAYTASAAGVLTADANGALTVDGVAVAQNDRLGLKDAAAGANNGIFVVTATGDGSNPFVLTPAEDFDSAADIVLGCQIHVLAGSANAKKRFLVTAFAGTYLTSAVTIEAGA